MCADETRLKKCPTCKGRGTIRNPKTGWADDCPQCAGYPEIPEKPEDYLVDLVVEKWDA